MERHLYLVEDSADSEHPRDSVTGASAVALDLRERIDDFGLDLKDILSRCYFRRLDQSIAIEAAVSGGADSLALVILAKVSGFDVIAHHVDHQIRPDSSLEADMVQEQLDPLGVHLIRHKVSVSPGPNLEERAREARYGVLPEDVSTGHTADDQVETVIYNLMRGAALKGLSGMELSKRHPILGVRKYETDAICSAVGLIPLSDPSNRDPKFVRNRVRNEVIPLLCDVAKRDVVPIIYRTALLLRQDHEAVSSLYDDFCPMTLEELRKGSSYLISMWLRDRIYRETALQLSWFHTQRCLEVVRGGPRSTSLPNDYILIRKSGVLKLILPTKDTVDLV
ncbi:tRNA(Ile)-lysidine synthase [Ferrithrix thermotolerans DSM 19514]|uniref:tRNA(Ile)-lysidine synthase n=1 Tax=Ferrithrix thermotolerans DSM 19514 TaxID=1121881 RepID=A0A1M4THN0_9ACTN|nr:tRNA(Ile)-lysidine synthase [Ferrithrix thermotolerans DSM 19514]